MPICALCRAERKLSRSHIIPEALYRQIYDAKRRMYRFHRDKLSRPTFVQKGLTQHLLCDECEHLINDRYEKPFIKYWLGTPALPKNPPIKGFVNLADIDYPTFKLFHLSVLWRAGVCKLEAFSPVNLGPFELIFREMLLAGDPGPDTFVQIFAVVLTDPRDGSLHTRTVMYPGDYRFEGRRMYVTAFGGAGWHYIVSKQPTDTLKPCALTQAGTMILPTFDMIHDFRFLGRMFERLGLSEPPS
jgi:hypothetical protein